MRWPNLKCPGFIKTLATNVVEFVGTSFKTAGITSTFSGVVGMIIQGVVSYFCSAFQNRNIPYQIFMNGYAKSEFDISIYNQTIHAPTRNDLNNTLIANSTLPISLSNPNFINPLLMLMFGGVGMYISGKLALNTVTYLQKNEDGRSIRIENTEKHNRTLTALNASEKLLSFTSYLMAGGAMIIFVCLDILKKTPDIIGNLDIPAVQLFFKTQSDYRQPNPFNFMATGKITINATLPINIDTSNLRAGAATGVTNVTELFEPLAILFTCGAFVCAFLALKAEKQLNRYSYKILEDTNGTPIITTERTNAQHNPYGSALDIETIELTTPPPPAESRRWHHRSESVVFNETGFDNPPAEQVPTHLRSVSDLQPPRINFASVMQMRHSRSGSIDPAAANTVPESEQAAPSLAEVQQQLPRITFSSDVLSGHSRSGSDLRRRRITDPSQSGGIGHSRSVSSISQNQ